MQPAKAASGSGDVFGTSLILYTAMSNPPHGAGPAREPPGLRHPTNGKTIYHRPLNRTRTAELSRSSFAYLFSEMVSYAQRRVPDVTDLEQQWVSPFGGEGEG